MLWLCPFNTPLFERTLSNSPQQLKQKNPQTHTHTLSFSYDRNSWPWAQLGAAPVNVTLALHKILAVDLYGGTLKLAVWLRNEWYVFRRASLLMGRRAYACPT